MKIALDTNVLLSTFISRGLCHELFDLIIANADELILPRQMLSELERHLEKKFSAPPDAIRELLTTLSENGRVVSDTGDLIFHSPDPVDTPILSAACTAGADIFVTGDKALLALRCIEKMRIVSPRECWVRLREFEYPHHPEGE